MLLVGVTAIGRRRSRLWPQRLLHIAQVEPNQPVGKQHCRDASCAAKAMDGCFANLQNAGKLAGGQVVGAFVLWLFRRGGFAGFRVVFLSLCWHLIFHRFK